MSENCNYAPVEKVILIDDRRIEIYWGEQMRRADNENDYLVKYKGEVQELVHWTSDMTWDYGTVYQKESMRTTLSLVHPVDPVVVKHFCNTLFEKFTRHIWLQMVFSNHCMNEGGHDYTIHTHSGLVLHLSWLHHKNDWDISIHFLVYYRNAPSVRYHKDSLPYSCFDKFPYFHNN